MKKPPKRRKNKGGYCTVAMIEKELANALTSKTNKVTSSKESKNKDG